MIVLWIDPWTTTVWYAVVEKKANTKILLDYGVINTQPKLPIKDKKIEYTLKNIEGEDWLKYEWLDISKIDEYPLLPTSIKSVLKENKLNNR